MIYGEDDEGYELICDKCEMHCDFVFESFMEAVEYKRDRTTGWTSRIDSNGRWIELCPDCSKSAKPGKPISPNMKMEGF